MVIAKAPDKSGAFPRYNKDRRKADKKGVIQMKFTKVFYTTLSGIPCCLADFAYSGNRYEITDAIEDSKTIKELEKKFNAITICKSVTFERETDSYIRFKAVDVWDNIKYIKIVK